MVFYNNIYVYIIRCLYLFNEMGIFRTKIILKIYLSNFETLNNFVILYLFFIVTWSQRKFPVVIFYLYFYIIYIHILYFLIIKKNKNKLKIMRTREIK